ncbi:AraC family transcriptional regulator [Paenibacillus psychroresistens]|uniref:AraC family transcriptional regulator n=1 Tax=Paenibacillus psychroresistens TaxID=1778678 RepID=A0A6B8RE68_9BACL|nr:AraC family transcriptional regulator [Paenibacillus psychroresistens]QGQ94450.1 AraC family transcriptional regulator [Paenibacillus psychroresistens]
MSSQVQYSTYGFRFLDTKISSFYQLFAVGRERIVEHSYNWDGLTRVDGPLLLFQYTISDQGCIDIQDKTYDIYPNQAFLVEIPGQHRYYLPKSSESWEFGFILFRPHNILEHWETVVGQLGPIVNLPKESSVVYCMQEAFIAASNNRITDGFIASSIVYQFVMELLRFSNASKKAKSSWPPKIQQAVDYLDKNYDQLHSLEEIAQAVGLSKFHFTRSFSKTTGLTPIEYLTKIRMEKSIEYLRQTQLTMDEIARKLGYSNGSYYSKVFHKWVGFPPGEFRSGRDMTLVNHLKFD